MSKPYCREIPSRGGKYEYGYELTYKRKSGIAYYSAGMKVSFTTIVSVSAVSSAMSLAADHIIVHRIHDIDSTLALSLRRSVVSPTGASSYKPHHSYNAAPPAIKVKPFPVRVNL